MTLIGGFVPPWKISQFKRSMALTAPTQWWEGCRWWCHLKEPVDTSYTLSAANRGTTVRQKERHNGETIIIKKRLVMTWLWIFGAGHDDGKQVCPSTDVTVWTGQWGWKERWPKWPKSSCLIPYCFVNIGLYNSWQYKSLTYNYPKKTILKLAVWSRYSIWNEKKDRHWEGGKEKMC